MKWFKHFSTLGESTSINNLIDEKGLIYYAHWMLFLELLAEKFDGNYTTFDINLSVISRKVRIKSNKKLTTFIQLLPNFFEITIEIKKNYVRITYDKLLEIKDNHVKNLQVKSKLVSENLPLDKDKDKDKDKDLEKRKNSNARERSPEVLEKNLEAKKLLTFWNSKNIIQHHENEKIISEISRCIKKKLNSHSVEQIQSAIENYSQVIHNPKCFFKYKWSLVNFLNREGASKFYPDEFIFDNFFNKKQNHIQHENAQSRQDRILSIENPYVD